MLFNPFTAAVLIIATAIFVCIIIAFLNYIQIKDDLTDATRYITTLQIRIAHQIPELQKLNKAVIRRNYGIKALRKKLDATTQLSLNLKEQGNERQITRNNSSGKRIGKRRQEIAR